MCGGGGRHQFSHRKQILVSIYKWGSSGDVQVGGYILHGNVIVWKKEVLLSTRQRVDYSKV